MTAIEICRKWIGIIGLGFHPDTRGDDYVPALSPTQAAEYEADMYALFTMADAYPAAVEAMQEAGLELGLITLDEIIEART